MGRVKVLSIAHASIYTRITLSCYPYNAPYIIYVIWCSIKINSKFAFSFPLTIHTYQTELCREVPSREQDMQYGKRSLEGKKKKSSIVYLSSLFCYYCCCCLFMAWKRFNAHFCFFYKSTILLLVVCFSYWLQCNLFTRKKFEIGHDRDKSINFYGFFWLSVLN